MTEILKCGDCQKFCRALKVARYATNLQHVITPHLGNDVREVGRWNDLELEIKEFGIRSCSRAYTQELIGKPEDECLTPEEFEKSSGNSSKATVIIPQSNLGWLGQGKQN